ncbi:hypothetical protein WA158_005085 [Blastocystis sp. Blastoise]
MRHLLLIVLALASVVFSQNEIEKCGTFNQGCTDGISVNAVVYSNEIDEIQRLNVTIGFYGGNVCYPSNKGFNARLDIPFTDCVHNETSNAESCILSDGIKVYVDMISVDNCEKLLNMKCDPPIHNGEIVDGLHGNYTCKLYGYLDLFNVIQLNFGDGGVVSFIQLAFNETNASVVLDDGLITIPRIGNSGCYEKTPSIDLPKWTMAILGLVAIVAIIGVLIFFINLFRMKIKSRNSPIPEEQAPYVSIP